MAPRSGDLRFPPKPPTLAELLNEAGYYTSVWSQHNIYDGNRTFQRGFENFTSAYPIVLADSGPEYSDELADRRLLPKAADLFVDERPTFAFIHLLPPHTPYQPPPPFLGTLSGWYSGDYPVRLDVLNTAHWPDGRKPTVEDVVYVRSRYDENVAFADDLVGRLLRMIQEAGRYEDAMVVLTSDHGEGFFEHGRFLHSALLYDEFLRIPLIVKWPRASSGFASTVEANVSLVDLVPTLVDGLALTGDFKVSRVVLCFRSCSTRYPSSEPCSARRMAPGGGPREPW